MKRHQRPRTVLGPVIRRHSTPVAPEVKTHRGEPVRAEWRVFEGEGRKLQGGMPPEPNRTPWSRAGLTGKIAREPFASRAVKGEYFATKAYLEG